MYSHKINIASSKLYIKTLLDYQNTILKLKLDKLEEPEFSLILDSNE